MPVATQPNGRNQGEPKSVLCYSSLSNSLLPWEMPTSLFPQALFTISKTTFDSPLFPAPRLMLCRPPAPVPSSLSMAWFQISASSSLNTFQFAQIPLTYEAQRWTPVFRILTDELTSKTCRDLSLALMRNQS